MSENILSIRHVQINRHKLQTNVSIVLLTEEFKRLHDHMILNKYIKRSAKIYERDIRHRVVWTVLLP